MSTAALKRSLAQGEVNSKIHWGASLQEALDHLQQEHGISGEEAEQMISEALTRRQKTIRQKAMINLIISLIVLAIPVTYFVIKGFVGMITIGFGSSLMATVGLASFFSACRNIIRLLSGTTSGSAE